MGKSNQFKLLLFKGAILASMLALLAGVVGTVYAQSSTGSSTTGVNSENDTGASATNTGYDEQQEALWTSRAQSLIPRVQLAINGGQALGRSTTDMQNALTSLQNTLAAADVSNRIVDGKVQTERGYRVELRNNYNFLKRAFNIYRAAFPDQFTSTSTTGVASTGSSACTTSPSTSSASPTAEATGTMAAVPATGSTTGTTTNGTCTCAAPSTGSVATATPVPSTGCAAPATGGTSSSAPAATSTPMPTATMAATMVPTATTSVTSTTSTTTTTATTSTTGSSSSAAATPVPTATMAVTSTATTAPAAPATGGTSSNCAAPAATPTPVPSTTASTGCAAPATGSTSSSTMSLDQFNAFVWDNRASTLIGRANIALNSNRMGSHDTTTMQNDLANLRTALAEPTGTQRTKDVQATYLILKRDVNQFRVSNSDLFLASNNTGVANTGSTSSSGTCTCPTKP